MALVGCSDLVWVTENQTHLLRYTLKGMRLRFQLTLLAKAAVILGWSRRITQARQHSRFGNSKLKCHIFMAKVQRKYKVYNFTTYWYFMTGCLGISTMTPGALCARHAISFFFDFLLVFGVTHLATIPAKLGRKLSWHFHFTSALDWAPISAWNTMRIVLRKYLGNYLRVLNGPYVDMW